MHSTASLVAAPFKMKSSTDLRCVSFRPWGQPTPIARHLIRGGSIQALFLITLSALRSIPVKRPPPGTGLSKVPSFWTHTDLHCFAKVRAFDRSDYAVFPGPRSSNDPCRRSDPLFLRGTERLIHRNWRGGWLSRRFKFRQPTP